MPDKRKHRGAHPKDRELFAERHHARLRLAVEEYSWLLSRGYAEPSALKLVGDRHSLVERQRTAVRRSACSDASLHRRAGSCVALGRGGPSRIAVDGYNLLITLETALSEGMVLVGRDGCCRDLASMHGTYRKVEETAPAIELIAARCARCGVERIEWYLDQPVSNSGLLRAFIGEVLSDRPSLAEVELVRNPDRVLAEHEAPVVSSDSWILDRCRTWTNLAAAIIDEAVPGAWLVRLGP